MIEIASTFKARIWLGELPQIAFEAKEWLRALVPAEACLSPRRHSAALELFIPAGPHFYYGLLGCEFHPDGSDHLELLVAHQQKGEIVTGWSLARGLDEVQSCIPLWAAEEILRTSAQVAASKRMGSGRLCFGLGCSGQLGSSILTFRVLTKSLIEILFASQDESLENLITGIIRERG